MKTQYKITWLVIYAVILIIFFVWYLLDANYRNDEEAKAEEQNAQLRSQEVKHLDLFDYLDGYETRDLSKEDDHFIVMFNAIKRMSKNGGASMKVHGPKDCAKSELFAEMPTLIDLTSAVAGYKRVEEDILIPDAVEKDKFIAGSYEKFKWPHSTVYYRLDSGIPPNLKRLLDLSIKFFTVNTCIRFITSQNQKSVFITNNPVGDYATFGHQDFNAMNIDSQLTSGHRLLGNILHLWMHIFGVPHMYTAPDRGFYMKICSDNIDKNTTEDLNVNGKLQTPFFDEFDYYSIMNSDPLIHLNAPLMVPKNLNASTYFGQRISLSKSDMRKLTKMYGDCYKSSPIR